MWNVHRMFITHIGIPKHKNHLRLLSSGTKLFYYLWVKRFFNISREAQSFYDDVSICTPTRTAPVAHKFVWPRPGLYLNSSIRPQKLTDFSQISQNPPRTLPVNDVTPIPRSQFSIWDFYFDISEWHKKKNYRYLGILEADTIKEEEMKEKKIKKDYLRRTKKLLETKLYSRNLIKRINTWAVSLVRYSGPFSKWTRKKLEQMGQRTRTNYHTQGLASQRWCWQTIRIKKRGMNETWQHWRQRWCIDTTTQRLYRKARRKSDHSH